MMIGVEMKTAGVKSAVFKDVNAIMQAPPLALTSGLNDMALDNPFLQVTDPAIVRTGAADMSEDWMSAKNGERQTLDDYLLEQIYLEFRDVPLRRVLIELVSYLDEDGYLRTPLKDIEREQGCSHQTAEDALAILQTLSPTGVGARDLRECLLLQLDAEDKEDALVRRVVSRGLKLVAANDIRGLCAEFDVNPDEAVAAIAHIKRLSPAPGSYYAQPRPRVAVPEVEVTIEEGLPVARIMRESRVRIDFDEDYYADMLKQRDGGLRRFIAQQRRDYDWLAFNLKKRYEVLLAVSEFITSAQADYFLGGAMKPLLVRDAVSATHLTAGSVNRIINGHYLQWQGKPVELRKFFSYRADK